MTVRGWMVVFSTGLAAAVWPLLAVSAADDGPKLPAGKRYLIIHADDAGMSHSVNLATIEAMDKGIVTSASILVPCPWFVEFAEYARTHPDGDYGIHLTLTSEFEKYRWGPVAPREKIPSLLDPSGYLWRNNEGALKNVKIDEVEIELRAQIERAREFGVRLSHLDTHMGTMLSRPDLLELYINLGIEYNLPVMFSREAANGALSARYPALRGRGQQLLDALDRNHLPVLARVQMFYEGGQHEARKRRYLDAFAALPEGVSEMIVHCGIDNPELSAITGSSALRDSDRRTLTDPSVKAELERLGVSLFTWKQFHSATGRKYLIVHADDAGMSHSVNRATIEALEKGSVSSCSIMVPCPWFVEFAEYANKHPEHDYGVHLTLNSEWKHLKWGPVAPRERVPSLIDKDGYLWMGVEAVAANAKASEVEIELRAQIDRAKRFGVPISHLDTHMGALVSRRDLLEVFAQVGLDYKLPILWFHSVPPESQAKYPGLRGDLSPMTRALARQGLPMLDALTTGVPDGDYQQRRQSYLKVIRSLRPGVNEIIIHCGVDDDELRGATNSWKNRDNDRRIFTEPAMRDEIKNAGAQLIRWRELRAMTAGNGDEKASAAR